VACQDRRRIRFVRRIRNYPLSSETLLNESVIKVFGGSWVPGSLWARDLEHGRAATGLHVGSTAAECRLILSSDSSIDRRSDGQAQGRLQAEVTAVISCGNRPVNGTSFGEQHHRQPTREEKC
jgi:hypothetical protein